MCVCLCVFEWLRQKPWTRFMMREKIYADLFVVNLFSEWASFGGRLRTFRGQCICGSHSYFYLSLMISFTCCSRFLNDAYFHLIGRSANTKPGPQSQCSSDIIQTETNHFPSRLVCEIFVSFSSTCPSPLNLSICILMIGIFVTQHISISIFIVRFEVVHFWTCSIPND